MTRFRRPCARALLARAAVGLFGVLALVTGCSGDPGAGPAPSSSRSSVLTTQDAFGCAPGAQRATLPSGALAKVLGSGADAVVFVNTSADEPCVWLPYAQTVADGGRQVLLWYYGNADRLDAVTDAVELIRARGAKRVLLVGGSQGAGLAVAAAGTISPPVAGVVAMSPGTSTAGASLPDAFAAVRVPLLEVIATEDCSPRGPRPCKALFDRASVPDKAFLSVPGSAHATALFHSDQAAKVTAALDRFIAAKLP